MIYVRYASTSEKSNCENLWFRQKCCQNTTKLGVAPTPPINSDPMQGLYELSSQIIVFHQPWFPWNKGISLSESYLLGAQVMFSVAIIWPELWIIFLGPGNPNETLGKPCSPAGNPSIQLPSVRSFFPNLSHHPFPQNQRGFKMILDDHPHRNWDIDRDVIVAV